MSPSVQGPQNAGGYGLIIPASTYGENAPAHRMLKRIFLVTSNSVNPTFGSIESERSNVNYGPTPAQLGRLGLEGDIGILITRTHLGPWLALMTGDTDPTSAAVADAELRAADSYTAGTAFTDVLNPKDELAAPVNAGQIELEFATAPGVGTITVIGVDQIGQPLDDSIAINGTDTIYTTTSYYSEINSVLISVGTVNVTVTAKPNRYTHSFVIQEENLPLFDMETVKGTLPSSHRSMRMGEMTLNFGETLELVFSASGRKSDEGQNIEGGATPTATTDFLSDDGVVMTNWETEFYLDGDLLAMSTVDLTFNQNIASEDYFFGDIYPLEPTRQGKREMTVGGTTPYNNTDLAEKALGVDVEVIIRAQSKPKAGPLTVLEFKVPQARLTEYPTAAIEADSPIDQTVSAAGYSTTTEKELEITLINGEDADAVLGKFDVLELSSGDKQTAAASAQLAEEIAVFFGDQYGNPMSGQAVAFASSDGTVGAASVNSDADGIASTTWTLSSGTGEKTATATIAAVGMVPAPAGSPVTFTATAT